MKILIGKISDFKNKTDSFKWISLSFDNMRPQEIRDQITEILENDSLYHPNNPTRLITLNRTVLDMVEQDYGIAYEDIWVLRQGEPVPLLSQYEEAWFSHFLLGDLLEKDLIK